MKKVKLTDAQFAWIASIMNEHYRAARSQVIELTDPSACSFYQRNDAEDVRLRSIKDCQNKMRFLEELRDAMV